MIELDRVDVSETDSNSDNMSSNPFKYTFLVWKIFEDKGRRRKRGRDTPIFQNNYLKINITLNKLYFNQTAILRANFTGLNLRGQVSSYSTVIFY